MGVANVPAASAGGGLEPYYQKFTSSGTFTLPSGYDAARPLLVNIQVIGGGGGGAGANSFIQTANPTLKSTATAYFGSSAVFTLNTNTLSLMNNTGDNGSAGGSGGIAASQLYLTGNLAITVGAAGARGSITDTVRAASNNITYNQAGTGVQFALQNSSNPGGTGGTTTAGLISAAGGTGGQYAVTYLTSDGINTNNIDTTLTTNISASQGVGGTPAGTTGKATPLLGSLAGGSGTTTPIFGSYGVGGIRGDGNTSTGVEGTGGGFNAIAASGAVILTWWE